VSVIAILLYLFGLQKYVAKDAGLADQIGDEQRIRRPMAVLFRDTTAPYIPVINM
jgi:hypothetical protein